MPIDTQLALGKTLLFGVLSAGLYLSLYLLAEPILELSRQGHWMFMVPMGIALVFSYIHGHFTGYFWDWLGFKPKSAGK